MTNFRQLLACLILYNLLYNTVFTQVVIHNIQSGRDTTIYTHCDLSREKEIRMTISAKDGYLLYFGNMNIHLLLVA